MYKVTYQVASEMQKRIWRPCGFSVGVGEGLSHSEDSNMRTATVRGGGASQGTLGKLRAHETLKGL